MQIKIFDCIIGPSTFLFKKMNEWQYIKISK